MRGDIDDGEAKSWVTHIGGGDQKGISEALMFGGRFFHRTIMTCLREASNKLHISRIKLTVIVENRPDLSCAVGRLSLSLSKDDKIYFREI